MRFLGIDPGIATTGYGIIETKGNSHTLITYGAILTPSTDSLSHRLHSLYRGVVDLITEFEPKSMAVEELFFNTNTKTALVVAQARGVILLAGETSGQPITGYTPLQVKMAVCGYGRADKRQVQDMVKRLLALTAIPKPDDAADALAIAICHSHSHKLRAL